MFSLWQDAQTRVYLIKELDRRAGQVFFFFFLHLEKRSVDHVLYTHWICAGGIKMQFSALYVTIIVHYHIVILPFLYLI
jgi:hypothetical protein